MNEILRQQGKEQQGLGVHWSADDRVAKNFALNDQGNPTKKVAGVVYHGYVDDSHVWNYDEPGSLDYHDEHEIYHPDSEEYGGDYGENELTVKEGKPVHITGTTSYINQEPFKEPVPFNITYEHPFKAKA
jgi:hypothetical protein